MPWSWDIADAPALEWIRTTFPPEAVILDVGPGMGKWGTKLRPYFHAVDGLEYWAPYVIQYNLSKLYRHIYVGDIRYWRGLERYDLLVLGDVFEHLTEAEALRFLAAVPQVALIIVPWSLPQRVEEGNTQETHQQPDLTEEVMQSRFPQLKPLHLGKLGGAYVAGERRKVSA